MTDFLRNIMLDPTRPIRVLFVCLGNICRSPAAEGILRDVVERNSASAFWEIDSAGTGHWHIGQLPDPRMRSHARRRGIELTHICRVISTDDYDRFDIIIGMDRTNISELRRLAPSIEGARKVVEMREFFSPSATYDYVPDPYYEGHEGFELVLDLLEDACQNMYDTLTKIHQQ